MANTAALVAANGQRWKVARLTRGGFDVVARRLCRDSAKQVYLEIQRATGVPWFIIAVIHEREASQRFDCQLGQGDPLNQVSTHDPKGRGPFATFQAGAIDALTACSPFTARNHDWSAGGALTALELYNGLGYFFKGDASPYVWSGTDQYVSGKFVADHVYDPDTVDVQLGCAGVLLAMSQIDSSVRFGDAPIATARVSPTNVVPVVPSPSIVPHDPGSSPTLANWLKSLFAH